MIEVIDGRAATRQAGGRFGPNARKAACYHAFLIGKREGFGRCSSLVQTDGVASIDDRLGRGGALDHALRFVPFVLADHIRDVDPSLGVDIRQGARGDVGRLARAFGDDRQHLRRCRTVVPFAVLEVAHAFLAAGRELGYPTLADYNAAEQTGFAAHQHTIYRGRRAGNADAFLFPALRRQNLSLRSRSMVTRLLIRAGRVIGVEYLADGEKHEALARRNVILSCGTYNTPQLLMLSGIGAADELQRLEISPVLDLPGVGLNLWDHPMIKTA